MNTDIQEYNSKLSGVDKEICDTLIAMISARMPEAENKVWHGHPVWFLDGNPIAGYSKLKDGVQLLFWSGQSFDKPGLQPEGSFKAAQIRFTETAQIHEEDIARYIEKAKKIQWDYKNIVKNRGELHRL